MTINIAHSQNAQTQIRQHAKLQNIFIITQYIFSTIIALQFQENCQTIYHII